jgi:cytochrome c nitrite reductase small subunit
MKKLMDFLKPPPGWRLPVTILSAVFCGLGIYTFYVSNAISYLSDDPKTCVNCHIMAPQYATWNHSSHREVASCNDCHVPHDNIFNTYFFKAKDGMRHAAIFTMRGEEQVIKITEPSVNVVQENCKRCHDNLNEKVNTLVTAPMAEHGQGKLCWDCHREVPHGRVKSLSSVPYARVPVAGSPVPEWLKKVMNKNKSTDHPKKDTNPDTLNRAND